MKKVEPIKSVFASLLVLISIYSTAQTAPDISLVFFLDENSATGTLVGAVSATDPDGDELSYSITSGNDDGAFSIVSTGSTAGTITVANGDLLDFEITPTFELIIEANDGNGGMTTAKVTVNLNDIDEDALSVLDDLGIAIYPNPVADFIFLDLGSNSPGETKCSVYDARGNLVLEEVNRNGQKEIMWDTEGLTNGIYLLRIELQDRDPISVRLVKKN